MLAPIEERMMAAIKQPVVSKCTQQELIQHITQLLIRINALTGFTPPAQNDFAVLVTMLASELLESFRGLTPGEVSICFERGAKGDWGDFMGLNIRTFVRWLKQYQTSDFRYRAVTAARQAEGNKAIEAVSESERERSSNDFLQRTYQRFLNGEPMERLMPARAYRMLQERNLICHTAEEKWAAMRRFENWRPQTRLPLDEVLLLQWRKSEAMNYLLTDYFRTLEANGALYLPL